MLGGEYTWIIASELANQRAPKALFTCVECTNKSLCERVLGFAARVKNTGTQPLSELSCTWL